MEILSEFAKRKNIGYSLLSDQGSEAIKKFGILNDSLPTDSPVYGIPYPGSYLLDAQGRVKSKYFEPDFKERFSAGTVLVREFGAAGEHEGVIENRHLKLTYSTSAPVLRPGQRVTLILDVELKPKMHVYAPGVQDTYIPVSWKETASNGWTFESVTWPQSRILHLPAINEKVPVYENKFRIVRDVLMGQEKELKAAIGDSTSAAIESVFRYQACDDRVCYPPENLTLKWTVPVQMHDRTRSPAEIRHKF